MEDEIDFNAVLECVRNHGAAVTRADGMVHIQPAGAPPFSVHIQTKLGRKMLQFISRKCRIEIHRLYHPNKPHNRA